MNKEKKRTVPSIVRKALATDIYLTDLFVKTAEKILPLKQLVVHYQVLEISCHGIPWFAFLLAFIWIANNKDLYQMQVNLLIGLLLDIVYVALLKAIIRRRRPSVNTDPFSIGPDKYSFPSGHASRSTFIVCFFLYLWPLPFFCIPSLFAWCVSVCLSRILLRRHHILDICAGVLLGIFNSLVVSFIFLEVRTCMRLISWITDEKVDGAEYDV